MGSVVVAACWVAAATGLVLFGFAETIVAVAATFLAVVVAVVVVVVVHEAVVVEFVVEAAALLVRAAYAAGLTHPGLFVGSFVVATGLGVLEWQFVVVVDGVVVVVVVGGVVVVVVVVVVDDVVVVVCYHLNDNAAVLQAELLADSGSVVALD